MRDYGCRLVRTLAHCIILSDLDDRHMGRRVQEYFTLFDNLNVHEEDTLAVVFYTIFHDHGTLHRKAEPWDISVNSDL